jgi:hypothetical protein
MGRMYSLDDLAGSEQGDNLLFRLVDRISVGTDKRPSVHNQDRSRMVGCPDVTSDRDMRIGNQPLSERWSCPNQIRTPLERPLACQRRNVKQ